ncbi:DUF357 domain-containing protein [Methanocalculus taiwanensis]|uniref:DUF357 domain-containing protein n=1 Tax=Methanocalculus taiwanensis TaxID=106207 RepID=UPI002100ED9B|nr:DUF357 domain-containing protein [Methanocalculus taiwanensis]
MISSLGDLCRSFTDSLEDAIVVLNTKSPFLEVGDQILEMAFAYLEDGVVFYKKDDPVNAMAAWCYGYGWLDAGIHLGLITTSSSSFPDMIDLRGTIPTDCIEKLEEKTIRYRMMLSDAFLAVDDAPDASSPLYPHCGLIREVVAKWKGSAEAFYIQSDAASALGSYSYAYGWLDAGVRSGLFRITGDRHLFTA